MTNKKAYFYDHLVLLEETNAMGGVVYFSNFVKWQGMAREYILTRHPSFREIISGPAEMITHSCSVRFLDHLRFGDTLRIQVSTKEIMPTSFVMIFEYFNKETGKLVAEGEQKVAFADKTTGQLCRVPREIIELVKSVEIDRKVPKPAPSLPR